MKLCVLCFLLLLACVYQSMAQGSYENCCLSYNKLHKNIVKQRAVDFRVQETDGGCNIHAIIFTMTGKEWKEKMTICANPKLRWVKKLKDKIQKELQLN